MSDWRAMPLLERLRKMAGDTMAGFPRETCLDAVAEIDRLTARVAELEADALRYRWIRERGAWETEAFLSGLTAAEYDVAVDEAMARVADVVRGFTDPATTFSAIAPQTGER